MRTVVGLDTDSKGWAAVVLPGPSAKHFKSLDKNVDVRRIESVRHIKQFFAALPPQAYVFCEEPLALKNGLTTRLLGLAAGAMWAAHLEFDITWFWVDVSSWKRVVIGRGLCNKLQIQQFFIRRGISYPGCLDLYDAHAIAMYGVMQLDAEDET